MWEAFAEAKNSFQMDAQKFHWHLKQSFFQKLLLKGVLRHLGSHLNKVNQIVGKQLVL